MQKLKDFIAKNGWKYNWLAAQLGIDVGRFYKILEGKTLITLAEALRVQDFTKGAILPQDFITQQKENQNG